MRNGYCAVVLVLLVASSCWAQGATKPALVINGSRPGGAYERLDPERLTGVLSGLGMNELLDAVVGKIDTKNCTPSQMAELAADRINDASREPNQPLRDGLLDQAAALYRQAIDATAKGEAVDVKVKNLEYRLALADTIGRVRCGPYVTRLMLLQGNKEDRQAVVNLTTPLLRDIRDLSRDVEDALIAVRGDRKARMLYLDGLEQFRDKMNWQLAGIYLSRGMALAEPNDAPERNKWLHQVVEMVRPFAEAQGEAGEFQFGANLRMGCALRELKTAQGYEQAADCFAKAGVEAALPETQLDAKFQAARNRIEQGKYDLAQAAIEDFTKTSDRLLGPAKKVYTDVKTALLTNDLDETQAAAQTDPAKAQPFRQAAQKCLMDFTKTYPEPRIVDQFMLAIGSKYRDRTDLDNLGALVLTAMAQVELSHKTGDGNEAMDKAEPLLNAAMALKDPAALEARPLVLWELAMLKYDRKDYAAAGELFAEIGKTPGAAPAMVNKALSNAVLVLQKALEEWPGDKAGIPKKLRQGYIDALELVLGKAGDDAKTLDLYFDLGLQRKGLADVSEGDDRKQNRVKAVEAFEKEPPAAERYLDGQFAAAWMRLVMFEDGDPAEKQKDAKSVCDKLAAFAAEAAKAAPAANAARAQSLRERGSQAAFQAIVIRYQYVDHEAALKDVQKLLDDWKGTSIIQNVRAWEIEILIKSADTAKVTEAIHKFEDFEKAYSPKEAEALLGQVVLRIEDQIKKLHNTPDSAKELEAYQKSYLEFATQLYKAMVPYDPKDPAVPMATINHNYKARQTYAKALLEGGQAAAALPVWQECIRIDEAETRPREAKEVAEEFAKKLAAVNAALAANNAEQLETLAGDFVKDAKDRGLDADDYAQVQAVKKALEGNAPAEKIKILQAKLLPGYTWLAKLAKERVAKDLVNDWGLAKTYWATKQYTLARKEYDKLLNGIPRESYPTEYWQTAYEMCQCWLEGYKTEKTQMAALVNYVRRLGLDDATFGGRPRDFEAIINQADQLSK